MLANMKINTVADIKKLQPTKCLIDRRKRKNRGSMGARKQQEME
jgi:hypothetical protein